MAGSLSCPKCQSDNPDGARFCMSCGASMSLTCESCGTAAPPGARFCMGCGSPLGAAGPRKSSKAADSAGEERRTVTVLFADLSGYTAVAERLDHETVKALVERCLSRFAAEVELFDGHVDKYIGDN